MVDDIEAVSKIKFKKKIQASNNIKYASDKVGCFPYLNNAFCVCLNIVTSIVLFPLPLSFSTGSDNSGIWTIM